MAADSSKYKELLSKVHQGVPMENLEEKAVGKVKATEKAPIIPEITTQDNESTETIMQTEPLAKLPEKRKRKPQADYQSLFFTRIDFTHRKPLYITATTHRRLMRIVHLMDESKATISSYVENIILNHLETFKEDIDTIYQTNNLNPTE